MFKDISYSFQKMEIYREQIMGKIIKLNPIFIYSEHLLVSVNG
jgi:hypothetical protein